MRDIACGSWRCRCGVFKIEILKLGGSFLAAEICAEHNRLLRRQHCSSLCSQSEGHEHVANMTSAPGHYFVGFSACAWPPQYSFPSLCEQSELQCFAPHQYRLSAYAGADTTVAGSRNERIWVQRRSSLGRCAAVSAPACATGR